MAAGQGDVKGLHAYRSRRFSPNLADLSVDVNFLCFSFSVHKTGIRAGLLWDAGMVRVCLSFQKLKMHKGGQFLVR